MKATTRSIAVVAIDIFMLGFFQLNTKMHRHYTYATVRAVADKEKYSTVMQINGDFISLPQVSLHFRRPMGG